MLLSGAAGAADFETPGVRRIELGADGGAPLPEIHIAPGLATVVFFDARIEPEHVVLDGRERFQRVGISEDHLALVPSATFREEERLRLEVRFHGGAVPERAAVMLVVDADRVERQVEVYRHPRTAESYRQEVAELKVVLSRLQREVEELRATRASDGIGAVVASLRGTDGFADTNVSYQDPGSGFQLQPKGLRIIHMAQSWTGLKLKLVLRQPGEDWTAAEAELLDEQGLSVKVRPPVQQMPVRFDQQADVVVPLDDPNALRKGRYTLKLSDAGGRRPVVIQGIEVP
nr:DUF2381 family protein [Pyxidicoccus fallax]